jgi:CDP-2,3-bis-(O-geranylgeranyl)-sn-glycerol synthase
MSVNDVLYALWFFVPAGFANATPIVVAKWPLLRDWQTPLDFGRTYRGKRIFGDSKTWRGVVCAAVIGLILFAVQQKLAAHLESFSAYLRAVNYTTLPLITGLLLGVGALLGDAAESFFKRQRAIAPGGSWFPFDQLDYIFGACLLVAPVVILPFRIYVLIIVVWLLMHLLFAFIGYLLHLKERPI